MGEQTGSDGEHGTTSAKQKQRRILRGVRAAVEMKPKKVTQVEANENANSNKLKKVVEETVKSSKVPVVEQSRIDQVLLDRQDKLEQELKLRDDENKEILM